MAAAVGITVLGAILNATAFTGGSILGQRLSGQGAELVKERERHDKALEKFNRDTEFYREYRQKVYDWEKMKKDKSYSAAADLSATDEDLRVYEEVADHPEPLLSSYYEPSEVQKKWEMIYIAGGLVSGGILLFLM